MTFVKEPARSERPRIVGFEVLRLATSRFAFSVLLTSIMLLTCVVSCTPVKPHQSNIEITNPEPNYTELTNTKSVGAVPNDIGPPVYKPLEVGPNDTEPNDVEPPETEPNVVEAPGTEPNIVDTNDANTTRVSFHNKCAPILTGFVNKQGMADYSALRRKMGDLADLLREFERLDANECKSWPKKDKIAFWINAYNLQMLRITVHNYPINSSRWERIFKWHPSSVRYIDKNVGGIKKQKFIIMREEFTLKSIEQRLFQKEFDEPRAFFALFHATLSGPPLRNEPYYGHKLDKQLDDQAKKFLSSTKAFKIDERKHRVYLPLILKSTWYGPQFIDKYGTDKLFKEHSAATRAVLNCIRNYIPRKDRNFLETENYSVRYTDYDWTIRDGPVRK